METEMETEMKGQVYGHDCQPIMYGDNQGTLDLIQSPKISDRTKHIDIAYHYVRDLVDKKVFNIAHIPSEDNLADPCTKSLPYPRFLQHQKLIMSNE
jgi:hypothetical protein